MAAAMTLNQLRRFRKAVKDLNALMEEILRDNPEAGYYLSNNTLNLMSGPSHTGNGTCHQENIVDSVKLRRSSGGDW